ATRRIGVQIYTVRDLMAQDMAGTLSAVARVGYQEVEFAGYFERSPAEVRRMLDDAGLAAPAAHVQLSAVRDDPGALIETAMGVGHQMLIVPWVSEAERATLDQWRALAETFNRFGQTCRDAGLRFAYHNHDFEFQP